MDYLDSIGELEIEPLSDDLLDLVAGASTTGPACCSCVSCSGGSTGCACAQCTGGTGPKLPTGGDGNAAT